MIFFFQKAFNLNANFHFSSRFTNTIVVALIALYYFMITVSYLLSYISSAVLNSIPTLVYQFIISLTDDCDEQDEKCVDYIKSLLLMVILAPLIVTPLICLFQIYFLTSDVKRHLKELYKGKCQFVLKAESIGNSSIAESSFHFGGFV